MKKSMLSVGLLLGLSCVPSLRAEEPRVVSTGRAFVKAFNGTVVDENCQKALAGLVDIFMDKLELTNQQWKQVYDLVYTGKDLLAKINDADLIALRGEYDKEEQSLLEACFNTETGEMDLSEGKELLQDALVELQKDPRFEQIFAINRQIQDFKVQVSNCLISDEQDEQSEDNLEDLNINGELKFRQAQAIVEHVLDGVKKKIN